MKHYDIGGWADYARDLVDSDLGRQMAAHLAAGCSSCQSALAAMQQLGRLAENESRQPLPEGAVRSVKALFAIEKPERAPKLTPLALQLAFDSFLEPAPAGYRSSEASSRHLVYYAQNYALDLRLDYEPEGRLLQLGGEILDRRFGPVANVPAFLLADNEIVSRSTSGDLGEFAMSCDSQRSLRLCLVMSEEECIDLALERGERRDSRLSEH